MPREIQMVALRTRAQQLADMVGDLSISPVEWNGILSEWFGEAYEEVCQTGGRYFEYTTTLTTDGTGYLAEPDDQLQIVDQLELILDASTGKCRRLEPIQAQQRARWSGRRGVPRAYELVDGRYFLYPTPPANRVITLRYVPQAPDLTGYTDTQVVDCVAVAGQKFIQYGAASEAVGKSSRDGSALEAKAELQRQKLIEIAGDRQPNVLPKWFIDDDDSYEMPSDWDF